MGNGSTSGDFLKNSDKISSLEPIIFVIYNRDVLKVRKIFYDPFRSE